MPAASVYDVMVMVKQASRAELIEYLQDLWLGWEHFGNPRRQAEVGQALRDLRALAGRLLPYMTGWGRETASFFAWLM